MLALWFMVFILRFTESMFNRCLTMWRQQKTFFFAGCSMLLIVRKPPEVVCQYSAIRMETYWPNRCIRIDRQSVTVIAGTPHVFACNWFPTFRKEMKSLSLRRCRHYVVQTAMVKIHLRWPLKDTQSLTIPHLSLNFRNKKTIHERMWCFEVI